MNPELRRNLWLEITVHRLVLVPGIILGAAFVGRAVLAPLALTGFVILVGIWGARQAAHAVIEEARERTWDIQRMSSLDPWTMTWGKLAGSTFIAWYGGLLCLALFLGSEAPNGYGERLRITAIVVFGALALQGAAMTAALVSVRLERRITARSSNLAVVIVLILLLPRLTDLFDGELETRWYGITLPLLDFWAVSAVVFAAWGIVGAYRAMCTELQVRTVPWLWLAFAGFIAVYALGFATHAGAAPAGFPGSLASMIALSGIVLSYVAAFAAPRDPVDYRRVLRAVAEGRLRRALEELPLWLSSATLALAAAAVCGVAGADPHVTNARPDNFGPAALALVCMMLRDLALLTFFSFHAHTRRAAATTFVYVVVLDGLLPALLDLAGLDGLRALVMPNLFDGPWFAVAVFAAHAAIAIALAVRAWRRAMPDFSRPGDRIS